MKKLVITICIAIVFVGFTSCKSEEQKKAEQFFSEVYSNEEGYRPIKTTVKVAKSTPQNDKFCLMKADTINYYMYEWQKLSAYIEPFIDVQLITKDVVRDMIRLNIYIDNINRIKNELTEYISTLDTTKTIGWEISQDFETSHGKFQSSFTVDENFQKKFNKHEFYNIVEAGYVIDAMMNNELPEYKRIPDETIKNIVKAYRIY